MAEIRPFRGMRYNQNKIDAFSKVICPPYDIISPQEQEALFQHSEYNFVRIEYNREFPQDSNLDNRYTRSSSTLAHWLAQGIIKAEDSPAIYFHEHYFTCQGKQYQRQNILALVRLEEWDRKIVRPHENIIPRAKSDRLSMLYACQCNTSPVLALYEDPRGTILSLIKAQKKQKPTIDVLESSGDRHVVWVIQNPEVIRQLQTALSAQPLYIADGHHRYDSALTYRREKAAQSASITDEEGFNFVMMSLTDFTDPGLIILPPHRLVRGISRSALGVLKSQLREFFDIEDLSINQTDIWPELDLRLTGIRPDMSRTRLAVYGLEEDKLLILTLRNQTGASQLMPAFHGDLYKKLDVSLVDHIILEKLLAFDKEKEEMALDYSYDRAEAVRRVKDQQYQLVFILNPVKPDIIKSIADIGDRMPRKSTYFYPKSPAGLVFYKW